MPFISDTHLVWNFVIWFLILSWGLFNFGEKSQYQKGKTGLAGFGSSFICKMRLDVWNTLHETNSLHLKMDDWNTFSFPFGISPYFQVRTVSFREGTCFI